MNEHIDNVVKRYSSLFNLPSYKPLLIWLLATCLINGFLTTIALHFSQLYLFALGLILGGTLFALSLLSDLLIQLSLKTDLIFNMRRCSALSCYSLLLWLILIVIGIIFDFSHDGLWIRFFSVGFCAALALRLLVLYALSSANILKIITLAFSLPVLYAIPVFYISSAASVFRLDSSLLYFFFFSITVTTIAVFAYMFSINNVGKRLLGVDSFSVLRAFIATWTENQSAPFERLFDRFGQERNIRLSALSFRNAKGIVKALMVVPTFHPGPFKNVGSSALPNAIQTSLENKLKPCIVAVPHGLSGHDLDLADQAQNQLVLKTALELGDISNFHTGATTFEHIKKSGASVGCQIFNSCALVTLTLAPETMEDLPPELDGCINKMAQKLGLSAVIVVDAHNSIQGPFEIDEALEPLKEAALASLKEASRRSTTSFQIGTAKVIPKEYGLREGMGPGGIISFIAKVGNQTAAYIAVDGNNMISGLREKILSALHGMGIDEGEVFTTDTHMVNAVVLGARGYHPIGEVMDHEKFLKYIKRAVSVALNNLEPAEAGWKTVIVPNVKVIGEKQIESMCILAEKAAARAKNLALIIFPAVGAVLSALLILL
jgi:putative membrane protein